MQETTDTLTIDNHWTLDKRVPVAALLAVIIQTGVMVWWAAGVEARIGALEAGQDKTIISRLVAVETKIDAASQNFGTNQALLAKLDDKLDRMLEQDTRK